VWNGGKKELAVGKGCVVVSKGIDDEGDLLEGATNWR